MALAGRPGGGGLRSGWLRRVAGGLGRPLDRRSRSLLWRYVALGAALVALILVAVLWRGPVVELRIAESRKPPLFIKVDKSGEFAVVWLTTAAHRGLPDERHIRMYQVLPSSEISAAAAAPEEGTPKSEGGRLQVPAGAGHGYVVIAAGGQVSLDSFAPDAAVLVRARQLPVLLRWWWMSGRGPG